MQKSNVVVHACEGWDVVVEACRQVLVECARTTDTGVYCTRHARDLLGLEVKQSTIPAAGLGLFATRAFCANEIIDEYKGNVVHRHEFLARPSAYGTDISLNRVIDSIDSNSCYARFSNDARSRHRNNAQLWSDRQYGLCLAKRRYRDGSGARVYLVAKKTIGAGEEIFNDYGSPYWRDIMSDEETEDELDELEES